MIKEKLLFYNDYSSINKKCFSCQQFNHIIEECPKLHFVPNIEKIIKTYNFPIMNERAEYSRNSKKSPNARSIVRNTANGFKKFKIKMQTMKNNVIDEEDEDEEESSSNEEEESKSSIDDENLAIEESEESKENHETLSKKYIYLNSRSKTKSKNTYDNYDTIQKTQKTMKTLSDDIDANEMNAIFNASLYENNNKEAIKEILNIQSNPNGNQIYKTSGSMRTNTKSYEIQNSKRSKEEQVYNQSGSLRKDEFLPGSISSVPTQKEEVAKDLDLDKVYNFKNYFPNSNIENIIKKFEKIANNEKEIIKRYVKKKYQNLSTYTFFTNSILEKFLEEAKTRRANRKSLLNKVAKVTQDTFINRRKSVFPAGLGGFPLKKKAYFTKNEQSKQEIKSFAELINTLVQQNRKKKGEK